MLLQIYTTSCTHISSPFEVLSVLISYDTKPLHRGLSSASWHSGKSLEIYIFTAQETGKKRLTVSSLPEEVISEFWGLPMQESSYLGILQC